MKATLKFRWFMQLSMVVAGFTVLQTLGLVGYELYEIFSGEAESVPAELSEIVVLISISACVFVMMLGVFWLVSKRMIRPLRAIAETAQHISSGSFDRRIDGNFADDEIGILAKAINQAFDRYHETVERMRRFSADASHQLRTPLAAVRNLGEVCLSRSRPEAEYRETIADMLVETQQLNRLVEKLLMLSRLEHSEVRRQFEAVDLAGVANEAVEEFRQAAGEKSIRLNTHFGNDLTIHADAALIGQAIANLLDNAIRHTPREGIIDIRGARMQGGVSLVVADSGPGIPEAFRDRVFERFSSVPASEHQGSGLGLAIVAEIAKAHDARVSLDATPEGGTSVRIAFPA